MDDITDRFGIGPDDRILAISPVDSGRAVCDVSGMLSAGGAVVLVGAAERDHPARWWCCAGGIR